MNAQAYDGNTPLHLAVAVKSKDLIRVLLSVNADAGIFNYDGEGERPIDMAQPMQEVQTATRYIY